ncbi:hypothetical protein, partial [Streptomyces europaeiscabiei]|uniref:hypothetical protein n=1 Tax=Streptomyces europaeiscabiei TaxID=146819 RepID=UPI0029AD6438
MIEAIAQTTRKVTDPIGSTPGTATDPIRSTTETATDPIRLTTETATIRPRSASTHAPGPHPRPANPPYR